MKKDLVALLVSSGTGFICLTNQGQWQLRIDFTFTNGTKSYLSYNKFSVGPANSQYQLSISGITPADPFTTHPLDGMKFTTKDRNNDKHSRNCAISGTGINAGGWWYNQCSNIQLNHQYSCLYTIVLNNKWCPLPFIEMKIKPITCDA